ncbi:MAG TPA: peptidase M23, partial [Tissierellales bacterium]|nr:peptidase M23 [Tissierellales bacterium]
HGGGIVTLYAHNSALVVSEGQSVKRGDTVSKAGSTGNSTGPHLHFEVRKDGAYVDPLPWLNGSI